MRVALVTSGLGTAYGGIGVVAKSIKSALEPDCRVAVWQHPPFWPRPIRIGAIAAQFLVGSQHAPDLIVYDHVHLAVLHAIFPSIRRIPYVVFLHGVEVWEPLLGRRRESLLGATLLIANSTTTVAMTRLSNPWLPNVHVTWLGIHAPKEPIDAGQLPPVGLIVGRMSRPERYKGHDAVMNAWPLIRSTIPDARLVVVGTGGDEARLRRRVEQERLEGIKFCGRLTDDERDQAYRSARLLFYPSEQEGFGLAGVEAAAFGVPVLGLAGTVTEEVFPNGEGAVLAKDLCRDSIAQAAIPVLTNNDFASRLGQLGRRRVQTVFLEEHFRARFRHVIGNLLEIDSSPYSCPEEKLGSHSETLGQALTQGEDQGRRQRRTVR